MSATDRGKRKEQVRGVSLPSIPSKSATFPADDMTNDISKSGAFPADDMTNYISANTTAKHAEQTICGYPTLSAPKARLKKLEFAPLKPKSGGSNANGRGQGSNANAQRTMSRDLSNTSVVSAQTLTAFTEFTEDVKPPKHEKHLPQSLLGAACSGSISAKPRAQSLSGPRKWKTGQVVQRKLPWNLERVRAKQERVESTIAIEDL